MCTPSEEISDSFKVGPPEAGVPAGQAVRDAFASDPRLAVREDGADLIRVVGGNVHTDLLDLRISEVTFHSEDNPRDATIHLLLLPEVKAYMQTHHIRFVSGANGIAPTPKGVHLSATLKNATISEALDRIAQSFPGVWIYAGCPTPSGERFVDFSFFGF